MAGRRCFQLVGSRAAGLFKQSTSRIPSVSPLLIRCPTAAVSTSPSRSCSSLLSPNPSTHSLIQFKPASQSSLPRLPSCRSFSSSLSPRKEEPVETVFDVNLNNFERNVVNSEVPVVIYFTASWCGPCKKFGPQLRRDIEAMNGAVKLAIVDVDKEQGLASSFKITNIPAVFVLNKKVPVGKPLVGVPPPDKYDEFLNEIRDLSDDGTIERLLAEAITKVQEGDVASAAPSFTKVLDKHKSKDDILGAQALAGLVHCVLKEGTVDETSGLVERLRSHYSQCLMDPFVKSAFSAVDLLSGGSANDEELAALQEKVSKDEDDLQSNLDLANAYLAKGRHEEAIDLLLKSIRKDKYWKESAARELLMKTIDSLGPNNALASQSRKRLTNLWFA